MSSSWLGIWRDVEKLDFFLAEYVNRNCIKAFSQRWWSWCFACLLLFVFALLCIGIASTGNTNKEAMGDLRTFESSVVNRVIVLPNKGVKEANGLVQDLERTRQSWHFEVFKFSQMTRRQLKLSSGFRRKGPVGGVSPAFSTQCIFQGTHRLPWFALQTSVDSTSMPGKTVKMRTISQFAWWMHKENSTERVIIDVWTLYQTSSDLQKTTLPVGEIS